jgi:hypothetical protein
MAEQLNGKNKGWERLSKFKEISELLSSGHWIMNNLNYFLFLALLTVIYIANGHMADKTIRNINKTQTEIKQLKYEYKTIKSEAMFKGVETELAKEVAKYGLNINNEVPTRLQP